ncbi:hypothetical protein [Tenuibacillus multivorans]|uniref:Uncharacterized protein n=1 Tax=Tenuibacillus multivorans TaxID=237069 RepID=A0A1G9ZK09_9BACI|nr:hypothetical protein [Tenuibacillus multivorans]GEL77496.1 hypothetical protein TMU01_17310 [Tenuibacillus multivorans]SDN20853.1 hypothetical protein SAMN05216498_1704 [Tenuibacillus multivorans]
MKCPNCQSAEVGRIGEQEYYCWSCFLEMAYIDGQLHVREIEEDGSLSSLDDLFFDGR